MIDGVGPISAVEPVSLSIASALSARQSVVRREKRLRWLKSLRAAQGLDEEDAAELERAQEEQALADMRARLATAQSIVEAMGGGPGVAPATDSHATITAAELALRIGAAGDRSLRAQARLSPAAVRQLVGWMR